MPWQSHYYQSGEVYDVIPVTVVDLHPSCPPANKIWNSQSFNVGTAGAKIFSGPVAEEFGYQVQQATNHLGKWYEVTDVVQSLYSHCSISESPAHVMSEKYSFCKWRLVAVKRWTCSLAMFTASAASKQLSTLLHQRHQTSVSTKHMKLCEHNRWSQISLHVCVQFSFEIWFSGYGKEIGWVWLNAWLSVLKKGPV